MLPSVWKGPARQTSVIICVGEEKETLIQSCGYGPFGTSGTVKRYRSSVDIRIIDPLTSLTVASSTINGPNPNNCPFSESFGSSRTKTIAGRPPGASDLTNWIAQFIPR